MQRLTRIGLCQSLLRNVCPLAGLILAVAVVSLPVAMPAQMVNPDIDSPGQPFSYPSQPTDEIGVMGAPSATEITPEGYLYTGFGELMFFLGPDRQPVAQRLRTLEKGYLPIVQYQVARDSISYAFEMFSSRAGDLSDGPVVNFVRVTAKNTGSTQAAAFLTTAIRYQADSNTSSGTADNRFPRPAKAQVPGDYQQPGVVFGPSWVYSFHNGAFLRNGEVLYIFPVHPSPTLALTLNEFYSGRPDLEPRNLTIAPTTPSGAVSYSVSLAPGEQKTFDFLMPLLPAGENSGDVAALRSASYDQSRKQAIEAWETLLSQGMQITLPESKVTDTFRASLIYDLLALNKVGNDYIQTVNQLQYHSFFLRDASDIAHMYDVTGYPELAAHVLDFFHTRQQPDGNFLSQAGQFDGWGQSLWAYGEHYRMTHDRRFGDAVYPLIVKAISWFERVSAEDPLHLMPSTDVKDNEYVPGHLTGYNFLALDGLQSAASMAADLGHQEDAERFHKDYDLFRANFLARLDSLTAKTDGYIPPDMDGNQDGTPWGNLLSITPEPQLDPHDLRVTATLRKTQASYQEGIITYSRPDQGQFVHHYLTIKNTLTEVVRGDQEQALRELYAELLHTTSTQAGFEYAIRPWGDRNFRGNLTPHGWFAADYRTLLRNMFVREEGSNVHVLSVTSPEWIGRGKSINITNAPVSFGQVSYTLNSAGTEGAVLEFNNRFSTAPAAILVHVPWFVELVSATADNKSVQAADGSIALPAAVHRVELHWRSRPALPSLSYAGAVEKYKREYRARYEKLLHDGSYYPANAESNAPGTAANR